MISVDERFITQWYAAVQISVDVENELNASNHSTACKNAAENATHTGEPPKVVTAPPQLRVKPGCFPNLEKEPTGAPCSTRTPADYMAKPVQGEVGQGVGTLIPGTARNYYDRTKGMYHDHGDIKMVNGQRFVYFRERTFIGFWVKQ